jgi:hypothetical protein
MNLAKAFVSAQFCGSKRLLSEPQRAFMWRAVLSPKWAQEPAYPEGEEQVNDALLLRIEECRKLPLQALRTKYEKLFGESPRSGHKDYLFRRIAWRMQADRYGELSDQARQRALAIADDRDLRPGADSALTTGELGPRARNHRSTDLRLPLPGTVLTRSFKGKTVKVCVLPDGFRYEDRRFRSLSAVAEHITGTRWNGFVFFSLQNRRSALRG